MKPDGSLRFEDLVNDKKRIKEALDVLALDYASLADHEGVGLWAYRQVDVNAYGKGAALYIASDGNYEEAKADAVGTMPCTVLALEDGAGSKKVLLSGIMRDDSWSFTKGANVYVSTTTGTLTTTAPLGSGEQVQIVGTAMDTNMVDFFPSRIIMELE